MLAARQAKEAALEMLVEQRRQELAASMAMGDAAAAEKWKQDFPAWFAGNMMTTMLAPFTFMFKLLENQVVQDIITSYWRGLEEGLAE